MLVSIFLIIIGLVILIASAEGLVRGASSLASKLHISPLVIGLTVVSFGTSAPELTVNVLAALQGAPDLAVGNVIGSNIANILLVLGISALIIPLRVKSSTVWKEIPLAALGVILVFIMANDRLFDDASVNAITRTDGLALLALMAIFMYYVYGLAKRDRHKAKELSAAGDEVKKVPVVGSVAMTVAGLVGLAIGGRMLVTGAVDVAELAGLSEAFIGLTVVAIGTSLPELATSVVAAIRRHADIAIGNIVGSNIFNVFFVLGTTSVITPLPISAELNIDIVFSIFASVLLFVFMLYGGRRRLVRTEGMAFLALYAGYLVYLVMRG